MPPRDTTRAVRQIDDARLTATPRRALTWETAGTPSALAVGMVRFHDGVAACVWRLHLNLAWLYMMRCVPWMTGCDLRMLLSTLVGETERMRRRTARRIVAPFWLFGAPA